MMRRTALFAELHAGGLRVVTRLADGRVGAVFMIQPDGDVVSRVSRSFLADAGAQARHLSSIAETLEGLRGVGRIAHLAVVSLGGGTSYLAVQQHQVFAFVVVLGLAAQLVIGRIRKGRRMRSRAAPRRLARTTAS